ncbi:DUF262 domain-containing protein [Desulfobacterales bacterium HSG16]|nr:DUF262 domain-containing protein [Desulfobacterales bacterium HSG16]
MALKTILPSQFTKVLSALNDPDTIYVIPSFQRPYAWDEKQIKDLLNDMEKASRTGDGSHYLSALHLIPVQFDKDDDPLVGFVGDAKDILREVMIDNQLQKRPNGNTVKVYAVIDGQQRLTTLFLLAHIYFASTAVSSSKSFLETEFENGKKIPRLIQNPTKDHNFMMSLISDIWKSGLYSPIHHSKRLESKSQESLLENVKEMKAWADSHLKALNFLKSDNFKTSAIELEANYGLTSFMTLNDRGKPLSVLEKLKALMLQFVYDASQEDPSVPGSKDLIVRLHSVFGKIYEVINECQHTKLFSKKNGDNKMVRLLSCYVRLTSDSKAIWQGAEEAYDSFFRHELFDKKLADVPKIVENWCNCIDEVREQLDDLNSYLNGSHSSTNSLHFPSSCSLADDYKVTLLSLELQPHLLALLLKFRALHNKEWHERFRINSTLFSLDPIHALLDDVKRRAGAKVPDSLMKYLNKLLDSDVQPKTEISMLEVVERMQILDWNIGSRRYQGFVNWCHATFNLTLPDDFVNKWFTWRSPDDFVYNLLHSHNDNTNCRFLLKEYERSMGADLHFDLPPNISTKKIELEHVFAQNIDDKTSFTGFKSFGIKDREEFDREVLWRSGNFTWLSKDANASLGNKSPDIKGPHYCDCHEHPSGSGKNVCSQIAITKKLGEELTALGSAYDAMRFQIEGRCAELALFAVERFC